MIINDLNLVDFTKIEGNPVVTISNTNLKKQYDFPDPAYYFILSSAGRAYKILGNTSVLVNMYKGYFDYPFHMNQNQSLVISISKELFKNARPLDGEALVALNYALKKAGKSKTMLPNRL